jgi:hypothetical protein
MYGGALLRVEDELDKGLKGLRELRLRLFLWLFGFAFPIVAWLLLFVVSVHSLYELVSTGPSNCTIQLTDPRILVCVHHDKTAALGVVERRLTRFGSHSNPVAPIRRSLGLELLLEFLDGHPRAVGALGEAG